MKGTPPKSGAGKADEPPDPLAATAASPSGASSRLAQSSETQLPPVETGASTRGLNAGEDSTPQRGQHSPSERSRPLAAATSSRSVAPYASAETAPSSGGAAPAGSPSTQSTRGAEGGGPDSKTPAGAISPSEKHTKAAAAGPAGPALAPAAAPAAVAAAVAAAAAAPPPPPPAPSGLGVEDRKKHEVLLGPSLTLEGEVSGDAIAGTSALASPRRQSRSAEGAAPSQASGAAAACSSPAPAPTATAVSSPSVPVTVSPRSTGTVPLRSSSDLPAGSSPTNGKFESNLATRSDGAEPHSLSSQDSIVGSPAVVQRDLKPTSPEGSLTTAVGCNCSPETTETSPGSAGANSDCKNAQAESTVTLMCHTRTDFTAELILNPVKFPDIGAGDYVEIFSPARPKRVLLLQLTSLVKPRGNLDLSVNKSIITNPAFQLNNYDEVVVRKTSASRYTLSYIELTFKDQYVSQGEFWRFREKMQNRCCYIGQKVSTCGITVNIDEMLTKGNRPVACGVIRESTKLIFRSCSARLFWLVQMSKEMWNFASDGELYFERFLNRFVSDVFDKWSSRNMTHRLTVVYFTRTYFNTEPPESHPAVLKDYDGRYYTDLYHTVVENETRSDWSSLRLLLKREFQAFPRIAGWKIPTEFYDPSSPHSNEHHAYSFDESNGCPSSSDLSPPGSPTRRGRQRGASELAYKMADSSSGSLPPAGKRPGTSSALHSTVANCYGLPCTSHEGNCLEAINLCLNILDKHYMDRDLVRTGQAMVLITAGSGAFEVDRRLTNITKQRMMDNAIGCDFVSLTRAPLHVAPLFVYKPAKDKREVLDREHPFAPPSTYVLATHPRKDCLDQQSARQVSVTHRSLSQQDLRLSGTFQSQSSFQDSISDSGRAAGAREAEPRSSTFVVTSATSSSNNLMEPREVQVFNVPHWIHLSFPYHKSASRPALFGGNSASVNNQSLTAAIQPGHAELLPHNNWNLWRAKLHSLGTFSSGEQFEPLPFNRMYDLTEPSRSSLPVALISQLYWSQNMNTEASSAMSIHRVPSRSTMEPWYPLMRKRMKVGEDCEEERLPLAFDDAIQNSPSLKALRPGFYAKKAQRKEDTERVKRTVPPTAQQAYANSPEPGGQARPDGEAHLTKVTLVKPNSSGLFDLRKSQSASNLPGNAFTLGGGKADGLYGQQIFNTHIGSPEMSRLGAAALQMPPNLSLPRGSGPPVHGQQRGQRHGPTIQEHTIEPDDPAERSASRFFSQTALPVVSSQEGSFDESGRRRPPSRAKHASTPASKLHRFDFTQPDEMYGVVERRGKAQEGLDLWEQRIAANTEKHIQFDKCVFKRPVTREASLNQASQAVLRDSDGGDHQRPETKRRSQSVRSSASIESDLGRRGQSTSFSYRSGRGIGAFMPSDSPQERNQGREESDIGQSGQILAHMQESTGSFTRATVGSDGQAPSAPGSPRSSSYRSQGGLRRMLKTTVASEKALASRNGGQDLLDHDPIGRDDLVAASEIEQSQAAASTIQSLGSRVASGVDDEGTGASFRSRSSRLHGRSTAARTAAFSASSTATAPGLIRSVSMSTTASGGGSAQVQAPQTINPFDWSVFSSRRFQQRPSHNRRRWSHLFPTGRFDDEGHGVRVEDFGTIPEGDEQASSTDASGSNGSCGPNESLEVTPGQRFAGSDDAKQDDSTDDEVVPLTIESSRLNWKSLQSPGILPLTTDYRMDRSELEKNFSINFYSVTLPDRQPAAVYGYSKYEDLLQEMVCQRLSQDFQLLVEDDDSLSPGDDAQDSGPMSPGSTIRQSCNSDQSKLTPARNHKDTNSNTVPRDPANVQLESKLDGHDSGGARLSDREGHLQNSDAPQDTRPSAAPSLVPTDPAHVDSSPAARADGKSVDGSSLSSGPSTASQGKKTAFSAKGMFAQHNIRAKSNTIVIRRGGARAGDGQKRRARAAMARVKSQHHMTQLEGDGQSHNDAAQQVGVRVDGPVRRMYTLTMGHEIHQLTFDPRKFGQEISVKRYMQKNFAPNQNKWGYKYLLYESTEKITAPVVLEFTDQNDTLNWNWLDFLLAGYEEDFRSMKKYRRIMFLILPAVGKDTVPEKRPYASSSDCITPSVGLTAVQQSSGLARPGVSSTGAGAASHGGHRRSPSDALAGGSPFATGGKSQQRLKRHASATPQTLRAGLSGSGAGGMPQRGPQHASPAAPELNMDESELSNLWSIDRISVREEDKTIASFKNFVDWLEKKTKEKLEIKCRRRFLRHEDAKDGIRWSEVPANLGEGNIALVEDSRVLDGITCSSITVKVELGAPEDEGRYEWLYLQFDSVFTPYQSFHMEVQWLVAAGASVHAFQTSLSRKARQQLINFQQIPEYCRSTAVGYVNRRVPHPFVLPKVIEFSAALDNDHFFLSLVVSALLARSNYVIDSVFPQRHLANVTWPTLVHKDGYAFLHFSPLGIEFLQNRLFATSTHSAHVYETAQQSFRDTKKLCSDLDICYSIVHDIVGTVGSLASNLGGWCASSNPILSHSSAPERKSKAARNMAGVEEGDEGLEDHSESDDADNTPGGQHRRRSKSGETSGGSADEVVQLHDFDDDTAFETQ